MFTVLTVDDEYMIKLTLKKLVEYPNSPFRVVAEAEDGLEALELIRERSPDLVITDIRMPVMDGLELIQQAVALKPQTRFVILSGHDDFSYAQQALRFGVSDYLLKPVKPALLREMLDRLEAMLVKDRQSVLGRSEWLKASKEVISQLAEQIWLLNEREAYGLLEQAGREISIAAGDDAALLRQMYFDLLTLLDGELTARGGSGESVAGDDGDNGGSGGVAHAVIELPFGVEEVRAAAVSRITSLMAHIRKNRNWLSHQNTKRAAAYIRNHFVSDSLTLQEAADAAGMSASYFSRMFKEEYGISFIQYLTKLRMEKAAELLSDPLCKTYEIAYSVGYQDYPHFAKMFKKHFGLSPSDYKKRIGVPEV